MQLIKEISTCGASAGVFTKPRPTSDIGEIEIPQRSSLCYPFSKHGRYWALKRRDFITLLGGAAAAWPLAARAQQTERVRRIGVLMSYLESDPQAQAWYAAFREGLHKLGWTEGRNIRIDTRWAAPDDAGSMHSQGREACGFAGRAVEQVRARHQRLDRTDARPHCAGQVAGCRRRGG
jgi:hypothetical protein